jgi:RNA polymerase sigma-70 factor (ECF subfamily)
MGLPVDRANRSKALDATTLSPELGPAERAYVYAIAMKYVKDEVEADDVTQEALLLAHRHRDSFAGRSRYSTWLYRVAATAALMHLRKKRRRGRERLAADPITLADRLADEAPSPAERAAASEELEAVRAAAARLSPRYREVFVKRYGDGKSDAEVARELGLSVTASKSRAFRARAMIRSSLGSGPRYAEAG